MDRLKEKMNTLNSTVEKHEDTIAKCQARIKELEQENLAKEHEITSLNLKVSVLEGNISTLEEDQAKHKSDVSQSSQQSGDLEALKRKVSILEEEAEEADKNLRDTNEKLRLTDVKAEHFERKVAILEAERDSWEKKYVDEISQSKNLKAEIDRMVNELNSL